MLRQTFNACTSPVVQEAWASGVHLSVLGVIYSMKDGLLRSIVSCLELELTHWQGYLGCSSDAIRDCSGAINKAEHHTQGGEFFQTAVSIFLSKFPTFKLCSSLSVLYLER